MFETRSDEIAHLASECAVRTCWAQWVALGSPAAANRARASAIVDPEALVLLSLCVHEHERRLVDLVSWWARVGSPLTSVQRIQSVAARFPEDAGQRALASFAGYAAEAGDRRWSRHAGAGIATTVRRKGQDEPDLSESATLWLRLRAGFGVGTKADTLAFLLGIGGAWASTRRIAFATGYSTVAARSAASEMALARFIRETSERPAQYSAPAEAWAAVLVPSEAASLAPSSAASSGAASLPAWRFWSEIFAFLASVIDWSEQARSASAPGPHVLASRARDLMEKHARGFDADGIHVPRPESYRGLGAVDALLETTRLLCGWIDEQV